MGATCIAEWIGKELEKVANDYTGLKQQDDKLAAEIKSLDTAADSHTKNNRDKRKALQEHRVMLTKRMEFLGLAVRNGRRASTPSTAASRPTSRPPRASTIHSTSRYTKRLRDKVTRQLVVESDRMQIEQRMTITRENHRISRDAPLQIIPSHASSKDRVEAAKALVMLNLAVFKAELETGIFKKPVDATATEFQYDSLPNEVRTVVIAAWSREGLLPRAAIEQMVPTKEPASIAAEPRNPTALG